MIGSLFGWVVAKLRKPTDTVSDHFEKLTEFLVDVRKADLAQLEELQGRLDEAVRFLIAGRESEELSADAVAIYSVAVDYARNMIADRHAFLMRNKAT